ncbi:MAG: MMPL family transporter [Bacilli bacterium]
MKRFGDFICKNKISILIITLLLLIPAFIGMNATKINYDILVYLPEDIDTVKGQNILTEDFGIGSFSVTVIDNMESKDILKLESKIKEIEGVGKVISGYDAVGNAIPLEMLPSNILEKIKKGNYDLMLITYDDSTSSEATLNAVQKVREVTKDYCKIGGMSAMVLDTMDLSETEILIYIVIAVILCIIVLELSLTSYVVPFLLLINIGIAILFNLGTNIIFGEISYITKALVAVLQLGVTTDFSIFLYHSYENKKNQYKTKEEAMSKAIEETFTSVAGSSLTTMAGFLVLCTMTLTLGKDLGLVMAKGVLLGVICVLTVFPVLLLIFDKVIEKTKHKSILPKFDKMNNFIIKHHKVFFTLFIILLVPVYLANSKIDVYYKLDETLPKTLDSISANEELKEKFNIVSPEIILVDKDMKTNDINKMINEIEKVDGIDFALSFSKLSSMGIDKSMLSADVLSIFESDKYQMILLNSTYDIATDELNNQVDTIQNIITKYDEKGILAGEGPLMKDLVKISDTDFNNVNYSSIFCILIIMFFVLRSISLPILLISVIEFAIFINMSIPYFSDITLPFVAPIVLGTIQLGATIDYAILMTTTYLKHRKEGKEKYEAMRDTMGSCVNSIIVSALCFFGATFGVGVYSKLEMIGSLCSLISRGALISMLLVITVLPSVLLIFDKLILKTTMGFRKEKNNMKKVLKKTNAVLMIICITIFSTPVYALTKEETVYTKLNSDGSTKNILVNEHLINNKELDEIEDMSNLKDILNINGDEAFKQKDNSLTWTTGGNDIFYQGKTDKEMPVTLNIRYYLNGKEEKIEDIIGQSGKVTIELNYHNNDQHYVRVGNRIEELYTPFVVAAGTILDAKNNTNIEVSNGKIINNGVNNIIVSLAAPGLYESLGMQELQNMDQITISFNTEKFELPSIYSVITPKVLDNDDLKVFDKMDSLYSSVDTLQSSINEIEEGTKELYNGSIQVDDGTTQVYENLNKVRMSLEEIKNGNINLDEGLKQVLAGLNEAKELLNNNNSSNSIAQINNLMNMNTLSINKMTEGLNTLKSTYESFNLENLTNTQILGLTKEFYQSIGFPITTDDDATEMNINLLNVKYTYESSYDTNNSLIELLQGNNKALEETLVTFNTINEEINTLISTLEVNITKIEEGANTLSLGTTSLSDGVKLLTEKTYELSLGTSKLSSGIATLSEGIAKFDEEGISKISTYASSAQYLESKIRALIKLGEDYETFTMKSDSDEGTTKFVLVIDGIKTEAKALESKKNEEKDSFWTKIKNLFK